jgi:hypothetical protein
MNIFKKCRVRTALLAQVRGTLHAELIKAEAVATDHRANFAAERGRCDALIAELLKATADLMAAKEATARGLDVSVKVTSICASSTGQDPQRNSRVSPAWRRIAERSTGR